MEQVKTKSFESFSFFKRLKSMLHVDFRRMFTMPLFYIMSAVALFIPILVLVMTTMMDGSVSVNPTTGVETVIEGFDNTWQIIGSLSSSNSMMNMDLTSMCNVNLLYFIIAVFICIFVAEDFRSGYSKNLFTRRSNKVDYVISKSLVSFISGSIMMILFLIGSVLGGLVTNLPFSLEGAGIGGLIMCMSSKIFLVLIFSSLAVLMSIISKTKSWLSILICLGSGMIFYTMIPMLTPLDSTVINLVISLIVGIIFSIGLGLISNLVLNKTSLV